MTAELQEQALAVAVQVGVPAILWGDPGIGKTSFIYAFGEALDYHVEVVLAALREPTDFGGLPLLCREQPPYDRGIVLRFISQKWGVEEKDVEANFEFFLNLLGTPNTSGGVVSFAPPSWANRLKEAGKGLLFLDEISTARPAVQVALLRVVLERVVGDMALAKGIRVVAAANKPEQIAGGWDLSSPLANRFCHIDWDVDAKRWCNGMLYGWPKPKVMALPENWESLRPQALQEVTAFITHRQELLKKVPKDESAGGRAWPSPRSWEMAVHLRTACIALGSEIELNSKLVRGCVGDGPALEFFSYLEDLKLPDPEELLANPRTKLPSRDDQLYAALGSVVYAVKKECTVERWNAAWRVMKHAADSHSVDVAVAHASALAQARPSGAQVPPEVASFVKILRAAGVV